MAEKNEIRAKRPKSSGEGNSSARVTYQLPDEESSPPSSPGATYEKQPWTLKKIDLLAEIPEYNNRWSMFLGFIQIALGVLSVILGIVLIAISAAGSESAIGIWAGVIFIGSGVVGVLSFRKPYTRLVLACFALSVISVVVALIMFIMLCYFTNLDHRTKIDYDDHITFFGDAANPLASGKSKVQVPKIAVGIVLILVTLGEIAVAALQGFFSGKVFLIRGPHKVPQENPSKRYSASNPLPVGGADQEWGEYNAKPKAEAAGGNQSWGEYNPTAKKKTDQDWGEYKPRDSRPEAEGPPQVDPEWTEYKPQKGRRAMRAESQKKGEAAKRPSAPPVKSGVNMEAEGRVTYNNAPPEDEGTTGGGIMRRKATTSVNVEEDEYCPPPRDSGDYDAQPASLHVSLEV